MDKAVSSSAVLRISIFEFLILKPAFLKQLAITLG